MAEHHGATPVTPEEATRELLAKTRTVSTLWLLILGVLAVVGLVALIIFAMGHPTRAQWGYVMSVLAFLLGATQAAPIICFITRLAKGYWSLPIRRVAELFYVTGLVTTPLFLVMVAQLPDWTNRPTIWTNWKGGPVFYDSVFMIGLALTGLAMLYLTGLPDYAEARAMGDRGIRARLARGWMGTPRQWQALNAVLVTLGAFYLMSYVYFHLFITSDFAMSLVPGWKSSVFPGYHALSGFQAGLGLTLVTAALIRKWMHLERYIPMDAFWGASKLLLALSLLFFYFTWSELILPWYGRQPNEIAYLTLLMFGPYKDLFILSAALNWLIPWWFLIWNPIRTSIAGPAFVGAIIVVGNLLDRMRIYLASWSVADVPVGAHLDADHLPPTTYPGILEILIIIGAISAVGFCYMLAMKLMPPVSIWEFKTRLLLKVERPFLAHHEVAVVAKPR